MIKNRKTKAVVLNILMILIGIIILDIPFGLEPVIFDDSPAYLARQVVIGVVPGYPLFLSINRAVFGEMHYLQVVAVWQIVINLSASILLIRCLRKKFELNLFESIMFFILSFVPHAVFMPESMSSRMIVTEALAFPLFYILVICMLKAVWERKIKYGIAGLVIAVLLSLVRTQMMLTLVIPVCVIFYLMMIRMKSGQKDKFYFVKRAAIGICISLLLFIGAFCIYKQCNKLFQYGLVIVNKTSQNEYESNSDVQQETAQELTSVSGQNIDAQGRGVFCSKMIVAAEYEDKELFEDQNISKLYEELYNGLLKKGLLLNSLDLDLLVADRVFGQLDHVYRESQNIVREYGQNGQVLIQIAETLFRKHPLRWLKSGFLQVPSGLISTVFFHKREFYWFSYLVTFFVYFVSFFSTIWAIKKKIPREAIEFMIFTILISFLFVFATATAFIAQQRYVVYGFGIFYMALYCLLKPLVFVKIFERGEKNEACHYDNYSSI